MCLDHGMTFSRMKFHFLPEKLQNSLFYAVCIFCALSHSQSYADKLQCFKGQVSTNGRPSVHPINCTTASNARFITSCYLFRYQTEAGGSQNDTRLIYGGVGSTQFACDSDHICDRHPQATKSWMTNVTLGGRNGELFCCSTSQCNDPRLVRTPLTAVTCFVGHTVDNKTKGSMQSCGSNQCFNRTQGDRTEHQCDTRGVCSKYGMTHDECRRVTEGGVTKRLCCCDWGKCNLAVGSLILDQQHVAPPSYSKQDKPTVQPMVPMPTGLLPDVRARQEQKSRVAGIVSAAVLGTALVVLLVIVSVKQWQRYREKYNFSYMQLTADMMVL